MSSIQEMRHPNEKVRGKVEALSSAGFTQKNICDYLKIDVKTLRKHYREELDVALMNKTMTVAEALFRKATQGDNVTAMIFWLKCQSRGSWVESGEELEELKNKSVGKIQIEVLGSKDDEKPAQDKNDTDEDRLQ